MLSIKNQVEDALYRIDRNIGQFKGKVEDNVAAFSVKMNDFDEKLRFRRAENPLEVNEEWHAELTEDAISSVEKLQ